jgi:hypothetical protein
MLKCDKAQKAHPYVELNVPDGASGYVEQNIIVPVNPGRLTFRTWGNLEAVMASVSIVDGPTVHREPLGGWASSRLLSGRVSHERSRE